MASFGRSKQELARLQQQLFENSFIAGSIAIGAGNQGIKEALKMRIFEKVYAHMGNEVGAIRLGLRGYNTGNLAIRSCA